MKTCDYNRKSKISVFIMYFQNRSNAQIKGQKKTINKDLIKNTFEILSPIKYLDFTALGISMSVKIHNSKINSVNMKCSVHH